MITAIHSGIGDRVTEQAVSGTMPIRSPKHVHIRISAMNHASAKDRQLRPPIEGGA
jgi:hypothetical protein